MPEFTQYAVELRRKGMTKMLLWQEYHEQYQEQAYAYTQFCEHFTRSWFKTQKRSMRQLHVAGDKLFIDYCGPRLQVVNPDTGEVSEAEMFVATAYFGAFRSVISGLSDHPFRLKPITDSAIIRSLLA
ncbi:hypothetical protein BOO22_18075 [Vibrio cidicii]|nr:hypothetical protein [Vibrio cidicii]